MALSIPQIAEHPILLSYGASLSDMSILWDVGRVSFRPLIPEDVASLAEFLENLSADTRKYYNLPSFDLNMAQSHCDAIGKNDKLRMVVEKISKRQIIALFDFSFEISHRDLEKLQKYNIIVDPSKIIKMGPCIADDFQSRKVGTQLFPLLLDVAEKFDKKHMILRWGVFAENERAIHFYEKNGFKKLGTFVDDKGRELFDMMREV